MKIPLVVFAAILASILPSQADPFQKAEVSRVINKVSLLRNEQKAVPAGVGDIVSGQTAIKTGGDSRAELQFTDKTITRLGANALFRFEPGGRNMDLDGGTMLFSSPKGEGGGQVQAGAVTAAVTGTDFLLSYLINGDVKVIVLEGRVLVFLTKFPSIRRLLRTGQMVIVPSGATEIPPPDTIDLKRLLATSRLLESGGFGPLPSQTLLEGLAESQQGRIVPLPDSTTLSQQAAQTARNTERPAPPPVVPPPPAPRPQPAPFTPPPQSQSSPSFSPGG